MQRLSSFLVSPRAFVIPVVIFLGGLTLVVGSMLAGVNRLKYDGRSEVGFLAAPNWSINYLILLPVISLVGALLMRNMHIVHDRLVRRRMLIDGNDGKLMTDASVSRSTWESLWRTGLAISLVCGAIGGLVFSAWDWYTHSFMPISKRTIGDCAPDWSTAPLFNESVSAPSALVFSAAAYALQSVTLIFAFVFLWTIIMCGVFMVVAGSELFGRLRLVPDLRSSEDERLGFEEFEVIGSLILMTGFLTFVALYLTIVQNHYLELVRHGGPNQPTSIFDMLKPAFHQAASGAGPQGYIHIFVPQLPTGSGQAALLLGLTVLLVTFAVVPSIAFTFAAAQAKGRAAALARDPQFPFMETFGVQRDDALARLKAMKVWPYGYFAVNIVIAALALSIGGLFWPLLAPYLYTLLAIVMLGYVMNLLRTAFPSGTDPT